MRTQVLVAAGVCLAVVATMVAILLGGCRREASPPRVAINGKTWFVDLALTPQQQYRGLSGRTELPDDVGMLFMFAKSSEQTFCMRGCVIPLDIAFIDEDLKVVRTATMAVEADQAGRVQYSSQAPAKYVLEVAAGALAAAGVKAGDEVTFLGDIPH